MKKTMEKEQGITIIALVITIIILLILAGVAIGALTGENGLIARAQQSVRETEIADTIELARLDIMEVRTENNGEKIT